MANQPPIYVINMAKDTARMASMAWQLAAQGLAFERVEAVVGRELTAEQKRASYASFWYALLQGRAITDPELGCFLSHRKIYDLMIAREQEWAIIFEDDAELLEGFAQKLFAFDEQTREFDMVQFYAFRDPSKLPHFSKAKEFSVMQYSGPHASAAAYGMRLSGAQKMMQFRKIWTPSDKWLWYSAISGLRCCAIWPYPVKLEETLSADSTIAFANSRQRKSSVLWRATILPILRFIRFSLIKYRVD